MVRTPTRIGVLCLIALLATSVVAAGAVAANPGSGIATALQDNGTSDGNGMTDDGMATDGMNDSDDMDGGDDMNDSDDMDDGDNMDGGDDMNDSDDMDDGGDDALGTPGLAIVGFLAVAGVVGLVAVRRRG